MSDQMHIYPNLHDLPVPLVVVQVLLSALVRSPVDALDVLPERGAVGVALLAAGEGAHVRPVDRLNS